MNSKKTLSHILLIVGELLIITCFLYFGRNLDPKILILNIVVTSIIYALYFIDILFPMVDFTDKSQKTIGSLGLRWVFTFFYMILAIAVMVFFNVITSTDFGTQILVHAILLFLVSLGLYFAFSSAQKVHDVFKQEKILLSRIDEMRNATKEVQRKVDKIKDLNVDVVVKLSELQENLRFISPCNNQKAVELETNFLIEMRNLNDNFSITPFDYDKITESLENCERTYLERKQIYSN
jgi:hypothetical protein